MTRSSRAPDPDEASLRALEFAAITERLAAHTAFGPSHELAEKLLPVGDPVHVGLLQDQTDEAARLLELHPEATIGGARDIRSALSRARRGGRLKPSDLLDVSGTLYATDQFRRRLARWPGPQLGGVREELEPAPALRERIERSIDPSGEILDAASPALRTARRKMRVSQERLRERLNAMLRSTELAGAIGDAIVTQRAGRYVIPVRAEAKGRVPGIVHDQSASAATLFIEPLAVVELNNAWTEAALEAAEEEEKVLEALSREVETQAAALGASLAALARADLWMARARLGADLDGVRPAVVEDAVELLSARHPLLGPEAVAIDLRLGERFGYQALVITGPNTGGKTVALKTLGLLALMHQAGLRVPAADGARMPVFRLVLADIGDEQSIAQSLSTFSSHLRNVVRFLEVAGPRTLVLLDEIGAGTDPTEGSALAMAVLTVLLERGAFVAATTHYAELKAFAETQPGLTNAAVEFDVATLRPTYHLSIGLPGASQAFAIAERLGLAPEVLAQAREHVSGTHASLEETLAAIRRAESNGSRRSRLRARNGRRRSPSESGRRRGATRRAARPPGSCPMRATRRMHCWRKPSARWPRSVARCSTRRASAPAPGWAPLSVGLPNGALAWPRFPRHRMSWTCPRNLGHSRGSGCGGAAGPWGTRAGSRPSAAERGGSLWSLTARGWWSPATTSRSWTNPVQLLPRRTRWPTRCAARQRPSSVPRSTCGASVWKPPSSSSPTTSTRLCSRAPTRSSSSMARERAPCGGPFAST